jgi:hypothetical protein
LIWEYGTPKQNGMYFVAVKHGEGAGFQEFSNWEHREWQLDNGGKIVAFVGIESLNQQVNIQWPQAAPQEPSGAEEF